MIATAWNNGSYLKSGAGYGIKITRTDRDRFFRREWKFIKLRFEGSSTDVEINIDKDSFWNATCRELISKEIGVWLFKNRLATWPKNQPPKLQLKPLHNQTFELCRL